VRVCRCVCVKTNERETNRKSKLKQSNEESVKKSHKCRLGVKQFPCHAKSEEKSLERGGEKGK